TSAGMSGQLESTANTLYERLEQVSVSMTGQIEHTALRLTEHINATAGEVTEKVTTVTTSLSDQLDQSSQALGGLLEKTASRLDAQLSEATSQLSGLFDTTTRGMSEQLDKTTTELSTLFSVNTRMLTEQLDGSAADMTNAFAETAVKVTRQVTEANALMAQRLEKTSNEVTAQLDHAGFNMFSRIDTTARDLGQRFDVASALLERVTGDISGRLEGTGTKFAEIIDTASSQILTDLGKASDAFADGLGATRMEITGRLEKDTGLLVDRIDKAVRELDTAAGTTATKLEEAHKKFTRHVETANAFLSDQLATTATTIDERLEGISMQLTGKLELTGTKISERLEDVSTLVERSVDKFNDEMERVLVNRKDALDSLISEAGKRANEIDAVMTSYLNLIEESLASSEARAKEIGRIIAEQTAAATQNLEQEIGKLEAGSGGQIAEASRILREQHERAMQSMSEMLSATASDFQQTAQDMRITAQQVVKDIDNARSELKRAILDLPEETRSNADAMRRVVADQIAALNALADVVKRQTGTLDVSGPGAVLPRNLRETAHADSGVTQATPFAASGGQTRMGVTRPEPVELPPLPRHRPASQPGSSARPAALSREVEGLVDKLNVAARDLVEAIDGHLPRELEQKYAGGERHVYTHRLYEGRGGKLAQVLKSLYGTDRRVRDRADEYVRIFERLLDTMSAQPQGETLVEASLASESGRIYVMLGEATGHIKPQ
ncbi:MAG TPA: methyl-accepting chemotaxis protein, partial [Sphingomicrobium sp.]|nr:methyl-accepting chemotaxis protein [Sphingomicrobium sp.]